MSGHANSSLFWRKRGRRESVPFLQCGNPDPSSALIAQSAGAKAQNSAGNLGTSLTGDILMGSVRWICSDGKAI
jgi:hypothetical protein